MSANMMYRLAAHSYFKRCAVEKTAGPPCSTFRFGELTNATSMSATLPIFIPSSIISGCMMEKTELAEINATKNIKKIDTSCHLT